MSDVNVDIDVEEEKKEVDVGAENPSAGMEVETTNNHNGQEATEPLEVKAEEMKVDEVKAEPVNEEAQPKVEEANVVKEEAKEEQHVVVEKEEVKPEDLLSEEEEKELNRRFPLVTYKNGGTNVPLVTKYKIKWEGKVTTKVSRPNSQHFSPTSTILGKLQKSFFNGWVTRR